jgi:Uma2 family endonuclease
MQKPVPKYLPPEEYLAREETVTHKSEYYQGEIFAMAGNTIDHNRIVRNLTEQLNRSFQNKNCEAFNEHVRLCADTMQFFAYPDILVVCGKIQFYENRRDTLLNPILIVEVLSDSTENYDRGQKFKFYRSIPTLREYLLIDQYKIRLEQFSLGPQGKWMLSDYDGAEAVLNCTSIDFQIPLNEIYHRVEFGRAEGIGPRA